MKIWVCLQSVNPLRWAIRFGNRWRVVKKVEINIPMKTKTSDKSPHGYLVGDGYVSFKRLTARIGAK